MYAHNSRTAHLEQELFLSIVSMCSARILCRLRLIANNRKALKQPFKPVLQDALKYLSQLRKKSHALGSVAAVFVERAKEVIGLVDAWRKHQIQARLADLLEGIYRLRQVEQLQPLLNTIPNSSMDPTSRKSLWKIISKIARYREAARFLYRKARKVILVRNLSAALAEIPEQGFRKIQTNQYTPNLRTAIIRASLPEQVNIRDICLLLNIDEQTLTNNFAQQVKSTLANRNVHAEVLLLIYCESRALSLPPRVICSSKDACFLCNAFIRMHGKMHTPRSHGRLYSGWKVPDLLKLGNNTVERFNLVLREALGNSIRTLLSKRRKIVYPNPNKSTLLTLPVSASTLSNLILSKVSEDSASKCLVF